MKVRTRKFLLPTGEYVELKCSARIPIQGIDLPESKVTLKRKVIVELYPLTTGSNETFAFLAGFGMWQFGKTVHEAEHNLYCHIDREFLRLGQVELGVGGSVSERKSAKHDAKIIELATHIQPLKF